MSGLANIWHFGSYEKMAPPFFVIGQYISRSNGEWDRKLSDVGTRWTDLSI